MKRLLEPSVTSLPLYHDCFTILSRLLHEYRHQRAKVGPSARGPPPGSDRRETAERGGVLLNPKIYG